MPDNIDESGLLLCHGCICCNTSLYTDFPACVGCSCEGKLLCLEGSACLKLNTPTKKCICCDINITKQMMPLLKGQGQECCFVESIAIPPDREVPATLGICFVFCYPNVGICKTQNALVMNRA